ncbi:hypothetical protein GCM10009624_04110 [Gordonia sinesedis]
MGPGGYPGGMPPRPPRKPNWSTISAVIAGVVAVIAITVLVVSLAARGSGSSADDVAVDPSPSTAEQPYPGSPDTPEDTGTPDTSSSEAYAVRDAMQRYVDALNSRDLGRIRAAVCTELRSQAAAPGPDQGDLVLEGLSGVAITGDTARSGVITHLVRGDLRTRSRQVDESFRRENGTWYVCPGIRPDVGT